MITGGSTLPGTTRAQKPDKPRIEAKKLSLPERTSAELDQFRGSGFSAAIAAFFIRLHAPSIGAHDSAFGG